MTRHTKHMTPGVAPADPTRDTDSAPGRPTINDIARIADVSKKTVSRVLNKSPFVSAETRQKVEAIIERTGTFRRRAGSTSNVSENLPGHAP